MQILIVYHESNLSAIFHVFFIASVTFKLCNMNDNDAICQHENGIKLNVIKRSLRITN